MFNSLKKNVDHVLSRQCPMYAPRAHLSTVFIDGWKCSVIEFRRLPNKIRGRNGELVAGIVLRVGKYPSSQVCSEHTVPEHWYLWDTGQSKIIVSGHTLVKVAT